MGRKPKCVMILSEGPSDRAALTGFFTDLYAMIDPDIEVFFPILSEERLSGEGDIEISYNGDITSRYGITKDNVLPMLLKLFIHPELKKHPAYEYPASVCEVIHLVDIDGVYLKDSKLQNCEDQSIKLPFYDDKKNIILTKDRESLIGRNQRKRENLDRMINAKRLRITMEKDANESKEKPYRVFYFSKDIDHVLYGKANNERYNKVSDAQSFANKYYDEPLEMAKFFIELECASPVTDYKGSWEWLMSDQDTLSPRTNINVLVMDLLKRAKVKI